MDAFTLVLILWTVFSLAMALSFWSFIRRRVWHRSKAIQWGCCIVGFYCILIYRPFSGSDRGYAIALALFLTAVMLNYRTKSAPIPPRSAIHPNPTIVLDEHVLKAAADWLHSDLGDLSDLSPEMRDAIATVYYGFYALSADGGNTGVSMLQRWLDGEQDLVKGLQQYSRLFANFMSGRSSAKKLIPIIRECKGENAAAFEFLQRAWMDEFIYFILDAANIPEWRRYLMRRSLRNNSIPGLYGKLRFAHGGD